MEQVTIVAPPIDFLLSGDSAMGAKCVLYLENMVPPNIVLPSVVYLTRTLIWNQMADRDYLAGCMGDISLGVDPGKQFTIASGFPATENAIPLFIKFLGALEFMPGASHQKIETYDPPIAYHPYRDCIIVAPEVGINSAQSVDIRLGFSFQADADLNVAVEAPPPTGTTDAFRATLDANSAGNPNYCIRPVIPAISVGGTQIRVHVSALQSACIINHASIGVQSGTTSSTTTVPVELKFGGASGVTVPANQGAWSDWTDFQTLSGQKLLATFSLFNSSNSWAYKKANGSGTLISSTDCWNTADMPGATAQEGRTHIVDRVQIR